MTNAQNQDSVDHQLIPTSQKTPSAGSMKVISMDEEILDAKLSTNSENKTHSKVNKIENYPLKG